MPSALRRSVSVGTAASLLAVFAATLAQSARAEVVYRAHGRCRLLDDRFVAYDGHCTSKKKQAGGFTAFVVNLDDGRSFTFSGPNERALRVQTFDGLHNASYLDDGNKGIFIWDAEGSRHRLSVKLDATHEPNVSHENTQPSVGTALGALAGAIIGGLISGKGGGTSGGSSGSASSDPVAKAKDNCLNAVAKQTGNARSGLSVIRAQTAESGIGVDVRVPAAQAPWFCFADSKGNVKDVRYSGSEGAL